MPLAFYPSMNPMNGWRQEEMDTTCPLKSEIILNLFLFSHWCCSRTWMGICFYRDSSCLHLNPSSLGSKCLWKCWKWLAGLSRYQTLCPVGVKMIRDSHIGKMSNQFWFWLSKNRGVLELGLLGVHLQMLFWTKLCRSRAYFSTKLRTAI